MNDTEYAQYQKDQTEQEIILENERAKAVAKATLLERLGITEEEAQLLLGNNQ